MFDTYKHRVYADAIGPGTSAIEGHNLLKNGEAGAHMVLSSDLKDSIREAVIDVQKWLPFASEVYNISADLKDYVLVPVPIMYSDLPNRNGVAFPFSELSRFNPSAGMLAYQTWKGKPCFVEHNNQDWTKASGVICDASMRKMPDYRGDIYKVSLLTSFDRNRDPVLANSILTRERTSYSMGALCRDYRCSVCDASINKGGCDHCEIGKPKFTVYEGKLAYLQACDFAGFECSSVSIPAYQYATNPEFMTL